MITAKQTKWFQWGFHQYNKRLIQHSFHQLWLTNCSTRPPSPAVFILNHSSWWDGLICFHLNRLLMQRTSNYMMHESGMEQFPFFQRLGAFSVNRDRPKDIVQSLQYAVNRVEQGESIWIFPQGDERPSEVRPLSFLPGFLYITEQLPTVPVVPIAYYYCFLHERKPELFIDIGEPLSIHGASRREQLSRVEEQFTVQLEALKRLVIAEQLDAFTPLQKWKWRS